VVVFGPGPYFTYSDWLVPLLLIRLVVCES